MLIAAQKHVDLYSNFLSDLREFTAQKLLSSMAWAKIHFFPLTSFLYFYSFNLVTLSISQPTFKVSLNCEEIFRRLMRETGHRKILFCAHGPFHSHQGSCEWDGWSLNWINKLSWNLHLSLPLWLPIREEKKLMKLTSQLFHLNCKTSTILCILPDFITYFQITWRCVKRICILKMRYRWQTENC